MAMTFFAFFAGLLGLAAALRRAGARLAATFRLVFFGAALRADFLAGLLRRAAFRPLGRRETFLPLDLAIWPPLADV
jgi:hypothetical protein